MKRSFIREHGQLIDHDAGADGRPSSYYMPASMLGEEPTEDERASMLLDVARGGDDARQPAYALHATPGAEVLDALLRGLENGSDPSLYLLRYLSDERVRPAIVKAAAREQHDSPANVFQVLGLLGGPEAEVLLSRAIDGRIANPATFQDDPFFNFEAGALVTAACGLLKLHADSEVASSALIRVIEQHPCHANRESAAWNAADVVDPSLNTVAMRALCAALDSVLASGDEKIIVKVLPRYTGQAPDVGLQLLARLLDHEDRDLASSALLALLSVRPPFHLRALRILRSWIGVDRPLRMLLRAIPTLGDLVDRSTVVEVARRALASESPTVRLETVRGLLPMIGDLGRDLAAGAVVEEPDPGIARLLRNAAAPTER